MKKNRIGVNKVNNNTAEYNYSSNEDKKEGYNELVTEISELRYQMSNITAFIKQHSDICNYQYANKLESYDEGEIFRSYDR